MKIFGIGLSRTGTKSLTKALHMLGYSVNHFPRDNTTTIEMEDYINTGNFKLDIVDEFDAIIDMTPVVMFDGIFNKYPDAKYILTVRNPVDWYSSMEGLYERYLNKLITNNPNSPLGKYISNAHKFIYGNKYIHKSYINIFNAYNQQKIDFFKDKQEQFLVLNICEGDSWEKICNFLGHEVIDKEFPRIVNIDDVKNNYEYTNIMKQ